VNICVVIPARIGKELDHYKDLLNIIQSELKVDQSAEVNLRFAASPKTIFQEGGQAALL